MRARHAVALMVGVQLWAAACGGRERQEEDTSGGAARIKPCELLTEEQVATILPGADEGYVAIAGGSLIAGVDAYQCSYSNPATHLLTVIVNVAVDDARFAMIKPTRFASDGTPEVAVGDVGWLHGEDDDLKLTAVKGRALIDLELMAPGARQRSDALVDLARAVAARL